jgi:hypothetical protein
MAELNTARLREIVSQTIGPAPWYWKTFPPLVSETRQRFVWTYHGDQGALAYLVSLGLEQEPEKPRLALNTYCRPFFVAPSYLGVWCPEGRSLRLTCFDIDALKAFDFAEVAGWFKQSTERIYAATEPIADFQIPLNLRQGTHKVEVPPEFQVVDELIVPTGYEAVSNDDPAFALFFLYLRAGLVEVLPQTWFTLGQSDIGYQWITRAARDPESHRIVGDGIRIGMFLLQEDGCRLERWIEKRIGY